MIPGELKSGDSLEAGWLNRLVRAIVARTLSVGPGLRLTRTPAGTTLSLAPRRRAPGAAPAEEHWGETEPPVEIPADGDGEWNAVREAPDPDDPDAEAPSAAEETSIVDIDVDSAGRVVARHYRTRTVDSNGNVVAISGRDSAETGELPEGATGVAPGEAKIRFENGLAVSWGGDDPPDPSAEPPECGNPLNEIVEDNPLDGPDGSGNASHHPGSLGPNGGEREREDGGGGYATDNPLDEPGEGGYTPECNQPTSDE